MHAQDTDEEQFARCAKAKVLTSSACGHTGRMPLMLRRAASRPAARSDGRKASQAGLLAVRESSTDRSPAARSAPRNSCIGMSKHKPLLVFCRDRQDVTGMCTHGREAG